MIGGRQRPVTTPDELRLLEDTVADVFTRERAATAPPAALWQTLERLGLTLAGVPEDHGGAGGGLREAATVVRLAGRFAAPGPIGETLLLAAPLLVAAGLPIPMGPMTVVLARDSELSVRSGLLTGEAASVPWARTSRRLVVLADRRVCVVPRDAVDVIHHVNLAGEPRDDVVFDGLAVEAQPVDLDGSHMTGWGALARALAMAGAIEQVLAMTLRYAGERVQFGRAIIRFQAVQQQLAVLAGEAAAARAAVDAAVGAPTPIAIAAAKIRAGEAAGCAARIAHQVHGAIGLTDEHELGRFTRRLWSWRDEYGSERHWAARLGAGVAAAGGDRLWRLLNDLPREGNDG